VDDGLVAAGVWLNADAQRTAKSADSEMDFNMGPPTSRIQTSRVRFFKAGHRTNAPGGGGGGIPGGGGGGIPGGGGKPAGGGSMGPLLAGTTSVVVLVSVAITG
jgi:hypothetical protein